MFHAVHKLTFSLMKHDLLPEPEDRFRVQILVISSVSHFVGELQKVLNRLDITILKVQ